MSPDSAPPAGALAGDVAVEVSPGYVATVELRRPPDNFFDVAMIRALADAYQALDDDPACRVIVLCAAGKHFCAGANLGPAEPAAPSGRPASPLGVVSELYAEAVRLFEARTPVIAAVQGAAVGGGLGLACSADFRVAAPEARFAANFARLGFHQGFGLTVTLPGDHRRAAQPGDAVHRAPGPRRGSGPDRARRPAGPGRSAAVGRVRAGRRDRRLGPACGPVHQGDHARSPRRRGPRRHRTRGRRAEPPAPDRRLPRRASRPPPSAARPASRAGDQRAGRWSRSGPRCAAGWRRTGIRR